MKVRVKVRALLWLVVLSCAAAGWPEEPPEESCECPEGNVSDCCCSYGELERTNAETVLPLLRRVVATPYFGHFKLSLCSECDLWDDAPVCRLRDCRCVISQRTLGPATKRLTSPFFLSFVRRLRVRV